MKGIILLCVFLFFPEPNAVDGWSLFAKVSFKSKYIEEYNEKFLVPSFDSVIRAREGSEIILKGYYMPFDLPNKSIILSKNPYASCFFCGGAGPESVAQIYFSSKPPKFKTDQRIEVIGKLRLNDVDVNQLNFILEEAEIIKP